MKKFNFNSSRFSIAATNMRVTKETRPELVACVTINKFIINRLGSTTLHAESGNHVRLLCDNEATDFNNRFFLLVYTGEVSSSAKLMAHKKTAGVGNILAFNFAGEWSKMIQGKADATPLAPEALAAMGLCRATIKDRNDKQGNFIDKKTKYTGTKEVHFELVDTQEEHSDEEGNTARVWALTNVIVKDRSNESIADLEEEEEEEAVVVEANTQEEAI